MNVSLLCHYGSKGAASYWWCWLKMMLLKVHSLCLLCHRVHAKELPALSVIKLSECLIWSSWIQKGFGCIPAKIKAPPLSLVRCGVIKIQWLFKEQFAWVSCSTSECGMRTLWVVTYPTSIHEVLQDSGFWCPSQDLLPGIVSHSSYCTRLVLHFFFMMPNICAPLTFLECEFSWLWVYWPFMVQKGLVSILHNPTFGLVEAITLCLECLTAQSHFMCHSSLQ